MFPAIPYLNSYNSRNARMRGFDAWRRSLIGTIYKCEICGTESSSPVRWFVIHCSDAKLSVYKWDAEQADRPHALHFCGEGHAQIYISRWFESFCGSAVLKGGVSQ